MFMKKIGLGIAAGVAALAVASTANATTIPIGTLPGTIAGSPSAYFFITSGSPFGSSVSANFGDGKTAPTAFDDSFTFTIPTFNGAGSGSISTSFSGAANQLIITALKVNGVTYSVPTTSSGQSLSLSGVPITAGLLNTIEVIGTVASSGTYAGTMTFTAVPEAATWAMMLFGFGLMGVALRRRQNVTVKYA